MNLFGATSQHRKSTLVAASVILLGMASVFSLARRIDSHRPPVNAALEEERLYLNGAALKRLSLGFNGLAADWYWMRSLQYVGRKIIEVPDNIPIDSLGQLNVKLLAPLLDTATTLDPQFLEPHAYAAVVLADVDTPEAIRITRKGIAANPSAWRLYQHLGYIYWQQRDYKAASETYGEGARIPGAPAWMEVMRARMAAEGGSRSVAREIYTRMYEQAGDEQVREMARRRLLQLEAFEQQDLLRRVLLAHRDRLGRCPGSWQELTPALRSLQWQVDASGAPLDPAGTGYILDSEKCEAKIDYRSEVPIK